jgi:hypothetical protein
MRNWIERLIGHFKTNSRRRHRCAQLTAARRLLDQFCPRRLSGAAEAHGVNGHDVGRCIADNKRVHRR